MLDVGNSCPLPVTAPALSEPAQNTPRGELFPSLPNTCDANTCNAGTCTPDPLGAARGVAAALVLSVPFWGCLIWVGRLLAG